MASGYRMPMYFVVTSIIDLDIFNARNAHINGWATILYTVLT